MRLKAEESVYERIIALLLNNGYRQKQLAEYGAIVVNEPVVRTDNIITSYCPQTGPAVAFMLLEELVGTEKMLETKIAMGF